jgi:RNA recognition motif-containing protein
MKFIRKSLAILMSLRNTGRKRNPPSILPVMLTKEGVSFHRHKLGFKLKPLYRLYVGGLPFGLADSDLKQIFEPFGQGVIARVIRDRETRKSRGFGFVQ